MADDNKKSIGPWPRDSKKTFRPNEVQYFVVVYEVKGMKLKNHYHYLRVKDKNLGTAGQP